VPSAQASLRTRIYNASNPLLERANMPTCPRNTTNRFVRMSSDIATIDIEKATNCFILDWKDQSCDLSRPQRLFLCSLAIVYGVDYEGTSNKTYGPARN